MHLSKLWSSGNEWIVAQACTQRTEHSCLTGLVWFKRRTRLVSSFTLRSSCFNWESIDFLQPTQKFDFVCLIKGNQNFNQSYLPTVCCLPQHPSTFNGCFSHIYFSRQHLWVSPSQFLIKCLRYEAVHQCILGLHTLHWKMMWWG